MKRNKMRSTRRRARREKIKLDRLRKRLLRKERKQMKKLRKAKRERRKKKQESCSAVVEEKLNCFSHNNDHWKTKPLWTGELSLCDGGLGSFALGGAIWRGCVRKAAVLLKTWLEMKKLFGI